MNLIYQNWAKAGLIIALSIISYVYLIRKQNIALADKYILLNLAFLMLHQFEEYVYPGGFKNYFNNRIYNPFGFFKNKLTDKGIFWVNVILGWGLNIAVFIIFNGNITAMLIVITVLFINGIMHFFMAFKTRDYNPGLVTGAIFFIPLAMYIYSKLYSTGLINVTDILLIFVYAVLLNLMIPITIYVTRDIK